MNEYVSSENQGGERDMRLTLLRTPVDYMRIKSKRFEPPACDSDNKSETRI